MAWTDPLWSNRRQGFARRDSNLALIGAVLTGALVAFAALLLLVERVNPDQGARLRGGALDAVAPLWRLVSAPIDGLNAAAADIAAHWNTAEKLRAAQARAALLERRLGAQAATEADRRRLEGLLLARRAARRLVATADVSASGAAAPQRTAVIAAGLADGVRPGMPAVAADGVAGRVIEAGRRSGRILLLTDANSRVPVRVARTGWTGLAAGNGTARLDFLFDTQSATERLRPGDRLVTSGDGGLFPPDLPVGTVVDVRGPAPRVRPAANPNGLALVSIEAPWLPPPEPLPAGVAPFEPDLPAAPPPAPAGPSPAQPVLPATPVQRPRP